MSRRAGAPDRTMLCMMLVLTSVMLAVRTPDFASISLLVLNTISAVMSLIADALSKERK